MVEKIVVRPLSPKSEWGKKFLAGEVLTDRCAPEFDPQDAPEVITSFFRAFGFVSHDKMFLRWTRAGDLDECGAELLVDPKFVCYLPPRRYETVDAAVAALTHEMPRLNGPRKAKGPIHV